MSGRAVRGVTEELARGHQVFDRDLVYEMNSLVPAKSPGDAERAE